MFQKKFLILSLILYTSSIIIAYSNLNSIIFIPENNLSNSKISIQEFPQEVPLALGEGVMLQSYYWMTPDIGKWWLMLEDHVPEFVATGFDSLWVPPPSKTQIGDAGTNGYEPYDYYDLGEFDQKGRIRTRYGTREELESLIKTANSLELAIIADIVINHNVGGELEYNPFLADFSYTNFENIASGRFPRNYSHFYPNAYGVQDNYQFANFPDLSHKHPYVRSEILKWAKWLRDEIGFDGWRFDVALGIDPDMLGEWMEQIGGWGVAEYWGGTFSDLLNYLDLGNNSFSAFDFPFLYELKQMAKGKGFYDMRNLRHQGLLWNNREYQSVTFVKNHDTVRDTFSHIDENEHLAYAYILTHEGYPSVFWKDYFDLNLQPYLKSLIAIHNQYAKGDTEILFTDNDLYVMQRTGSPGLLFGLNDNQNLWKEAYISTKWINKDLTDLTGRYEKLTIDSQGRTTIRIPPNGFIIYGVGEPIRQLPNFPNYENPNIPTSIEYGKIILDGKLDEIWGNATYADRLGDGGLNQRDLTNLYLRHDENNLYLGFGHGQTLWTESSVHYGIAIDVKDGGSREDPWSHSKIKWAGTRIPDYMYYFSTSTEADSWREINQGYRFTFDSANGVWSTGALIDRTDFISNNVLGFTEVKIPLTDIEFSQGGNISLMVFSSAANKLGAVDSTPHDAYTDVFGDKDSWLTLEEPLFLDIGSITSQKSSQAQGTFGFEYMFVIMTLSLLILKRKWTRYS